MYKLQETAFVPVCQVSVVVVVYIVVSVSVSVN